jgi:hypothetical protein
MSQKSAAGVVAQRLHCVVIDRIVDKIIEILLKLPHLFTKGCNVGGELRVSRVGHSLDALFRIYNGTFRTHDGGVNRARGRPLAPGMPFNFFISCIL